MIKRVKSFIISSFCVATLFSCSKSSTNCSPVSGMTIVANNTTVYEGSDLSLGVSPAGLYTYQWSGPGGWSASSSSALRTNMQFANAGAYSVKVFNLEGCQVFSGSTTISVQQPPDAPCTSAGNTVTSSLGGTTNFTFAANQVWGMASGSQYIFLGMVNNDRFIQFSFSGSLLPNPGIYTTPVAIPSNNPVSIWMKDGVGGAFRSQGGDNVYVTRVGGKMQVAFCNVKLYDANNPSAGIFIYITGKMIAL